MPNCDMICVLFLWSSVTGAEIFPGGSPPRIVGKPEKLLKVKEGSTVKLKCPINGSEPFHIEWMKDGERIDGTTWTHHILTGRDDQFLKVRLVGSANGRSGLYSCKGVNGYGSTSFGFTIQVKSRFSLEEGGTELLQSTLRDVRVSEGDDFSLTCAVKNPGHVDLRWLKRVDEDKEIIPRASEKTIVKLDDGVLYKHLQPEEGSRMKLSDRLTEDGDTIRFFTLTVENVTKEDSGLYVCLVINSLVKLDKTFRYNKALISVIESPKSAIVATSPTDKEPRMSELTILVIVLPIVLFLLIIVLVIIARNNRREKSKNRRPRLDLNCGQQVSLLTTSDSFIKTTFANAGDPTCCDKAPPARPPHRKLPSADALHSLLGQPRVYHTPGRPLPGQQRFAGIASRPGPRQQQQTQTQSSSSRRRSAHQRLMSHSAVEIHTEPLDNISSRRRQRVCANRPPPICRHQYGGSLGSPSASSCSPPPTSGEEPAQMRYYSDNDTLFGGDKLPPPFHLQSDKEVEMKIVDFTPPTGKRKNCSPPPPPPSVLGVEVAAVV